jgi:hypothetical protein
VGDPTAQLGARTFEERQRLPRKVFVIVGALEFGSIVMVTALLLGTKSPLWVLGVVYLSFGLSFVVLAAPVLRTWVDDRGVGWNWFPFGWGRISFDEIETVEVEKVDAFGSFGGWGPKLSFQGSPRTFGLIASGERGVRVVRLNGKRHTVITSHKPEELATAILERLVAPAEARG